MSHSQDSAVNLEKVYKYWKHEIKKLFVSKMCTLFAF